MRWSIVLVMLLTACASAPSASSSTTSSTSTTTTTAVDSPDALPSDEQISLFVANLIETLSSTSHAAAVEEDPLPFVTSGALMCELLDDDLSPSTVLTQFLASFGPEPSSDESALAGALLGSAVNAFCPEYLQLLRDDLG